MNGRTLAALLVVATLAVLPAAQAAGSLRAGVVRLDAFSADGPLRAFRADGHGGDAQLAGFDLTLQAAQLTVMRGQRHEPMIVAGSSFNPKNGTDGPYGFSDALVATQQARGQYSLMVVPAADAHVDVRAPAAILQASTSSQAHQDQHIQGTEPPLEADVTDALLLSAPTSLQVTVTGTFDVSLWDWDLVVQSASGQMALPSGAHQADTVAAAGVQAYGSAESNETYLHATNATLRLMLPQAPDGGLYLGRADVHGDLTLTSAQGTMDTSSGAQSVHGTLVLRGADAGAQADAGAVALALGHSPDGAALNGQSLSLAPANTRWAWLLAAPGVVAAAWAGGAWTTRGRRHLRRAEDAMDRGDYEAALAASAGLATSRRHRIATAALRTIAFLRLGRLQEADRLLADATLWPGDALATRDFLAAHATAALGLEAEARKHLASCLQRDPAFRAEAAGNPLLAPLLRSLPTVREGYS